MRSSHFVPNLKLSSIRLFTVDYLIGDQVPCGLIGFAPRRVRTVQFDTFRVAPDEPDSFEAGLREARITPARLPGVRKPLRLFRGVGLGRVADRHVRPSWILVDAVDPERHRVDAAVRRELPHDVVSDPFHMFRVKRIARDLGFSPLASPTRSSPIREDSSLEYRYMAREIGAYLAYVFIKE